MSVFRGCALKGVKNSLEPHRARTRLTARPIDCQNGFTTENAVQTLPTTMPFESATSTIF
jgi:hypothetical protein